MEIILIRTDQGPTAHQLNREEYYEICFDTETVKEFSIQNIAGDSWIGNIYFKHRSGPTS